MISSTGDESKSQRTPSFWLTANSAKFHPRVSTNQSRGVGIWEIGNGLQLNRMYHLGYTLSDTEKRLDIYQDGQWVASWCINAVKDEHILFNDGPLRIG